jgi:UPF0042 nucleotide-binding protein
MTTPGATTSGNGREATPSVLAFVVITGLSGAGKSVAIKVFEDIGYFCVDNLPTTLIPTFAELTARSTREIRSVALGVDVREREYLSHLMEALRELRRLDFPVEVLFLEASDEALVRRYHESRRTHPLAGEGNLLDGIRAERMAMADFRGIADRILDTSTMTVHQFRDRLMELYGTQKARPGLKTTLISFGYKHGLPYDADLVLDVRFLPNPHFIDELRALDGRDPRIRDFIFGHDESRQLLERIQDLLRFLLPFYRREGKAYLTVAVGCTGGRHRSVALVEALRAFLEGQGAPPRIVHRDIGRE